MAAMTAMVTERERTTANVSSRLDRAQFASLLSPCSINLPSYSASIFDLSLDSLRVNPNPRSVVTTVMTVRGGWVPAVTVAMTPMMTGRERAMANVYSRLDRAPFAHLLSPRSSPVRSISRAAQLRLSVSVSTVSPLDRLLVYVSGKYGYQINSFRRLSCNPQGLQAADSLLEEVQKLAQQQINMLHCSRDSDCFRKEPFVLSPIANLKASTKQPPTLGQDKHFALKDTVSRVWNESTLTHTRCPLCWTTMMTVNCIHLGVQKRPVQTGMAVSHIDNQLLPIFFYKARVEIIDDTGRATLTLFDQPSKELFNASSIDINQLQNESTVQQKFLLLLVQSLTSDNIYSSKPSLHL